MDERRVASLQYADCGFDTEGLEEQIDYAVKFHSYPNIRIQEIGMRWDRSVVGGVGVVPPLWQDLASLPKVGRADARSASYHHLT